MEVLYHGIKTRYAYDFPLCFPHELLMSLRSSFIKWHRLLPVESKLLMPCEQKQSQNPKKKRFSLETKQNPEMSEEKHSDNEFYYAKEQQTAEKR